MELVTKCYVCGAEELEVTGSQQYVPELGRFFLDPQCTEYEVHCSTCGNQLPRIIVYEEGGGFCELRLEGV